MPLFEIKRIAKHYGEKGSRVKALASFSATFERSGLVSVLGKSGSGKSTLLCLLSQMEKPDSGFILFEGNDTRNWSEARRQRFLRFDSAFVFQHYELLSDRSVMENVSLPLLMMGQSKHKAESKAITLLTRFGLQGFSKRKIEALSGGEKQRAAICRALIKDPKVLFCDEPTGALDERNGTEVMKMLSFASKTRLVILVSHNKALVEEYSDRILTLQDGKLISDQCIKESETSKAERQKTRSSSRWIFHFLRKYFFDDRKRNALTFLSGLLGLSSILLSLGYLSSSPSALAKKREETLEYFSASIAKKEILSSGDSPLVLTRLVKPSMEETESYLEGIGSYTLHEDLSPFLPSRSLYQLEGEEFSDSSFIPIYDMSLSEHGSDLLAEGSLAGEGWSCYVNDVFYAEHKESIGKRIEVSLALPIDHSYGREDLLFSYRFQIAGVIKEFAFLNTPKIYYSYFDLEDEISSTIAENASSSFSSKITLGKLFEMGAMEGLSEKRMIYFHDDDSVANAFRKIDEGGALTLESSAYATAKSFLSISEAFSLCLWMLFGTCLLSIVITNAMSFLSLYLKRRKELALLFSLGARKSEILRVYLLECGVISFLYGLLSFVLFPFLAIVFNSFLNAKFGMDNLIGWPCFEPFQNPLQFCGAILLASLLISLLSVLIAIAFSMRKGLRKELRDE